VVKRLVGDEFSARWLMSIRRQCRARRSCSITADLPAFIDEFARASGSYLGDFARVEMAQACLSRRRRGSARPDAFAALARRLGETRVRLHPSLSIITSSPDFQSGTDQDR
jgi:hypothetical protein